MQKYARALVSIVLIVLVVGAGSGVAFVLFSLREAPPKRDVAFLPPLVQSVVVEARDVAEEFVGYGTAQADRRSVLAAEVASVVLARVGDIEAGSDVEAGQPLVSLDSREYELSLKRAREMAAADQAQLEELEAEQINLKRLKATAEKEVEIAYDERARVTALFETGQAHKREFDIARLAYQQARRVLQSYDRQLEVIEPRRRRLESSKRANEASQMIAQLNVERCTISAPFAGSIEEIGVDEGDHVGPGSWLVTLVDSSRVDVAVELPASARGLVALGASCSMECQSSPSHTWQGEVVRISPVANAQTRTFAVYAEVDNTAQESPLAPGTFVRAVVEGPIRSSAMLVPRGAIRRGRVLVVEDGVVAFRSVQIVRFLADNALVEGEIQDGDYVILSHLDSLTEGFQVRIQDAPADDAVEEGGQ